MNVFASKVLYCVQKAVFLSGVGNLELVGVIAFVRYSVDYVESLIGGGAINLFIINYFSSLEVLRATSFYHKYPRAGRNSILNQ